MAQLIAGGGGYAATVGGTVRIFGSNDVDVISLADIAGKISFDGSFNRGGDFIVLPNAARTYSIVRAGSSVTLSDADSTITIPVGSKGATLQFADGELVLKYDGQILLGNQTITIASAAISAPLATKTALPNPTSATGTLILAPNEPVLIGGNVRVFGTNGADKVTIADVPGNISFDGSFNRGGDSIVLSKFAESYRSARPSASNVMISDGDTNLTIPLGTKGLNVKFDNESRQLAYSGGEAYLGNLVLSSSAKDLPKLQDNIRYSKIENAFSGPAPFNGQGSSNHPIIFDANNDGYLDILFLWSTNAPILGEVYSGVPLNAQLQLLINQSGKGFVDQTDTYFPISKVDGGTDSFIIHDFNGDGILDVVLATSREDGRNTDNPMDAATQLSALISNRETGTFENIKFGQRAWYFYVDKFTINGKTYLSSNSGAAEKSVAEVFEFKSGNFQLVEGILPKNSASDPWQPFSFGLKFLFVDDNNDGSVDTLYNPGARGALKINGVATEAFTNGIDAYQFEASSGNWLHLGSYFPMNEKKFIKEINFVGWNLNEGTQPVFEYGPSTYSVRNDVYIASTIIKLRPNSDKLYASLVASTFFKADDIASVNRINEWDLVPRGYFAFFGIVDGALKRVEATVRGLENLDLFGAHYLEAIDYNRDGYDDIAMYTWNNFNSPLIFINNKDNSFDMITAKTELTSYNAGSFFADFNNDGFLDIFSYISDGNGDKKLGDLSQFNLYLASNSITIG